MAANIVMPTWQVITLVMALFLVIILAIVFIFVIFRTVPWAWTMYRAFQHNAPIVWKHHARGAGEIVEAKIEKELKEGVPVTYYIVEKWGLKFSDIAGENTELLMGKLRIIHYFKNGAGPVNIMDAVAIDQLCNWLQKKGVNVTNREDAMLFILSEYGRSNKLIEALEASKIDDEGTKRTIINAIRVIKDNETELKNLKLSDGVFVFQTAMTAIDRTIAFASAAFANSKSAIEAQVRAKIAEDKSKDMLKYIIYAGVFAILAGLAYVMISKAKW